MEIRDTTAVITGAASGIGAACAERLVAAGASVILADKNQGRLAEVVARLSQKFGHGETGASKRVHSYFVDVTDDTQMLEFRSWCDAVAPVDILINCAGILRVGDFRATSLTDWDVLYQTNLRSAVCAIQLFSPKMLERRRGAIVNIASASGRIGFAPLTAYGSLKFALVGLGQSLTATFGPHGVVVCTICPTIVRTNLAESVGAKGAALRLLNSQIEKYGIEQELVAEAVEQAILRERSLVDVGRDARLLSALGRIAPGRGSAWLLRRLRARKH